MLTRLDDIQEALNVHQRKDYETIDKILDVRQRAKVSAIGTGDPKAFSTDGS